MKATGFDLSYNVRFSVYAVPDCRGLSYIRESSTIRVSRSLVNLHKRLSKFIQL